MPAGDEYLLLDGLVVGGAVEHLDKTAEQAVGGVVVGEGGAGCGLLLDAREGCDVALQGVVTRAEVEVVVAEEARRVVQQVADGERHLGVRIGQLQLGQVPGDRVVEAQRTRLDRPHDRGGRDHLGDRADLEQGRSVHGTRELGVGDAEGGVARATAPQEADSHAGHVVLLAEGLDDRGQLAAGEVGRAGEVAAGHRVSVRTVASLVAAELSMRTINSNVCSTPLAIGTLTETDNKHTKRWAACTAGVPSSA